MSAEPRSAGIQRLGEAWEALPRLPQPQSRAASARIGTHATATFPHLQMAGVRRERRTRGCATQPRRVKLRPRGPSRKSRPGRPDPTHGMRSPGSHRVPGSVLGVQGVGRGEKLPLEAAQPLGKSVAQSSRVRRSLGAQSSRARARSPRRSALSRGRGSPSPARAGPAPKATRPKLQKKGAEEGTRRALRLRWRGEETATSPEPEEARMRRGKRGPPPPAEPRPQARPAFSRSSSPGTRGSQLCSAFHATRPGLHPHPCPPGLFGSNLF